MPDIFTKFLSFFSTVTGISELSDVSQKVLKGTYLATLFCFLDVLSLPIVVSCSAPSFLQVCSEKGEIHFCTFWASGSSARWYSISPGILRKGGVVVLLLLVVLVPLVFPPSPRFNSYLNGYL